VILYHMISVRRRFVQSFRSVRIFKKNNKNKQNFRVCVQNPTGGLDILALLLLCSIARPADGEFIFLT
jgi:hypothetical protein